jgi:acetylglutamate kinase
MADGVIAICQTVKDELGAVGEVVRVNTKLLTTLIEGQFLPLVSSIGSDINGQLLNINADDAATAIAQALDAELLLLSDVPGVLDAEKNLLTSLPPSHTQQLIAQGVIADGMQVKVQAAQQAANQLGRPVTIGSWRNADGLLKLFHAQMPGTQVLPSNH